MAPDAPTPAGSEEVSAHRAAVFIGGSGGIEALAELLSRLSPEAERGEADRGEADGARGEADRENEADR